MSLVWVCFFVFYYPYTLGACHWFPLVAFPSSITSTLFLSIWWGVWLGHRCVTFMLSTFHWNLEFLQVLGWYHIFNYVYKRYVGLIWSLFIVCSTRIPMWKILFAHKCIWKKCNVKPHNVLELILIVMNHQSPLTTSIRRSHKSP